MKKSIKKIISLVIAMALTISGITYKSYQIRYAMNNKFTKKAKIKKTKKLTYTVKKLQKNKKYYFRVRAVSNGINGKWSKTKKVKIKK